MDNKYPLPLTYLLFPPIFALIKNDVAFAFELTTFDCDDVVSWIIQVETLDTKHARAGKSL